jgi:hypothetical protein
LLVFALGQAQEEVAIKVQRGYGYGFQVLNETTILGQLCGIAGVPRKLFSGTTQDGRDVLVTEPVGVPLDKLRVSCLHFLPPWFFWPAMRLLKCGFHPFVRLHKAGEASRDLTLYLGEQLVTTLREVHERMIIHRDINPRNIICVFPPEGPTAVLIDFGLAVSVTQQAGDLLKFSLDDMFCEEAAHTGIYIYIHAILESLTMRSALCRQEE